LISIHFFLHTSPYGCGFTQHDDFSLLVLAMTGKGQGPASVLFYLLRDLCLNGEDITRPDRGEKSELLFLLNPSLGGRPIRTIGFQYKQACKRRRGDYSAKRPREGFRPVPVEEDRVIDCIGILKDQSFGNRIDQRSETAARWDMLQRCFREVQPLPPFSVYSLADPIKIF